MDDRDVRPLPAPWKAQRIPGGWQVCDATGRPLAYFYAGDPVRRTADWRLLSWEEARRLAVNFARLPELLVKGGGVQTSASPAAGKPGRKV